jgi:hypothetical protein
LDTANLNANGVYYFYQVPPGDYVVKAFNPENPGIGQRYFPSYSPAEVFWQTASTTHLTQNQFNVDISLTAVLFLPTGIATAFGDVSMTTSTSPVPLANVEILLLDSLMQAVDYAIAGSDGSYSFYGIEPGTYFLRPEIPGKVCEAISFQAGNGFPDSTEIHLFVPGNVIGINEPGLLSHASEVFPNPARLGSALEIDVLAPVHGEMLIFDITGRLISQTSLHLGIGSNTVTLPLENLRNGLYFLKIQLNRCNPLNRKFLFSEN